MPTAPITKHGVEFKAASQVAPAKPSRTAAPEPQEDFDENLYLTGRPRLKDFLRFVRNHAVDPPSPGSLTEEWQAAHDVVRRLQKEEAGIPDNPSLQPLSPDNQLLLEFIKNPLVKNTFNTVPTEVAYVDLSQIVVYQAQIDLTFVRQLRKKLASNPLNEEALFRVCLPDGQVTPPAKWSRMHHDTYVFVSPSNDLRFLGAMQMQPCHIQDYPPPGNLVGVVGLPVGFGSNFMNAIYAEKRLILNNGSHRAYALYEMGITRVPCIVQHVSSREELKVLACTAVTDAPNFYLKEPRPMMLKDYFDPRLHKVMPVHRRIRQITVKFQVDEAFIPAL
jgi:hypothetical protein